VAVALRCGVNVRPVSVDVRPVSVVVHMIVRVLVVRMAVVGRDCIALVQHGRGG